MRSQTPARVTLWVNRIIFVGIILLCFTLPALIDWYSTVRALATQEKGAILAAFYCCAAITEFALWNMEKLIGNILEGIVFVKDNINRIRAIRWCCLAVSLICLPAAFIYYPLIFMVIIMGFLSLVVNVVCQVMKAAVTIREENDLTI